MILTRRARPGLMTFVALLAALALLMADCDKGDGDGGGGYRPSPGDNGWWMQPRAAAGTVHHVILVGDSITASYTAGAGDKLQDRTGLHLLGAAYGTPGASVVFVNDGVGGQTLIERGNGIAPLTATFAADIAPYGPGDVVVVGIGMNDIFSYGGDAAWTSAYWSLFNQAHDKGMEFLAAQITPVSEDHWQVQTLRASLNTWLGVFGDQLVVHYPIVLQNGVGCGCWMQPQYGWNDGIHVNAFGYMRMGDLLATQLIARGWLS